jgi:hypothetical protein
MEIDVGAASVTSEKVRIETISGHLDGIFNQDETPGTTRRERPWNTHSRLRAQLGAKLAKGIWVYGGATFNVLAKETDHPVLIRPRGDYAKRVNDNVEMWPGFMAGIRFGRS